MAWRRSGPIRILLAVTMVLVVNAAASALGARQVSAYTYNCPFSSHCLGNHDWRGRQIGAEARLYIRQLSYPGVGENQFLVMALWNMDVGWDGEMCGPSGCSVEIGYGVFGHRTDGGWSGFRYYFFNIRASDQGGDLIPLDYVPSGDLNKYAYFKSWKNYNNSWSFDISTPTKYIPGYSSPQGMNADLIKIGVELTGFSGASSPYVSIRHNKWKSENDGLWRYQNRNGDQNDIDPRDPYGYWNQFPAASTIGGDWYVLCDCN
jgi:hypothetical protein